MIRMKCFRCQFFCFLDHRNRMTEVIQRLHAVHVHAHALLAQKGGQLRVAADFLFRVYVPVHQTAQLFFFLNAPVPHKPEHASVCFDSFFFSNHSMMWVSKVPNYNAYGLFCALHSLAS